MRTISWPRRLVTAAIALVIVATGVLTLARPGSAELAWDNGAVVSQDRSCFFASDRVHARVDWQHDAQAGPPRTGERYRIRVALWHDLSLCGDPPATIELRLPANTAPSIDPSAGAQITCYVGATPQSGCPVVLTPLASDHSRYPLQLLTGAPWATPLDLPLFIEVPIVSTAPLTNATVGALISVVGPNQPLLATRRVTVDEQPTTPTTPTTPTIVVAPPPPPPPPPPMQGFYPITPVRVLDTRSGDRVATGGIVIVPAAGHNGVPADATAVVLNVTATDPVDAGYLTVFPCGEAPPKASNVNYKRGESVPNLAVVKVGDGGNVCITTYAASHVIADLSGYYAAGDVGFVAMFPARLKDTRQSTRVPAGGVVSVPVAGVAMPNDGVGAVFNITVVDPKDAGYVTAYACDAQRPLASNLNYVAGQAVANLAMLGLGQGGSLCLFSLQSVQVVVDITGFFRHGAGLGFTGITPTRIVDTRTGEHLQAGETRTIPLTGLPDGATGVVANVTATASKAAGYFTVFPCGQNAPTASNVNFTEADTVPNLVAVGVGPQKAICVYSFATADAIVDVTGFYGSGDWQLARESGGPA